MSKLASIIGCNIDTYTMILRQQATLHTYCTKKIVTSMHAYMHVGYNYIDSTKMRRLTCCLPYNTTGIIDPLATGLSLPTKFA